jgi:hypothetical protein
MRGQGLPRGRYLKMKRTVCTTAACERRTSTRGSASAYQSRQQRKPWGAAMLKHVTRHTSRVTTTDDGLGKEMATCHKRWWSHVTSISCNCFHNTKTVENPPQAFVKNCSQLCPLVFGNLAVPHPSACIRLRAALHGACLSVCLSG